MAEGDGFSSRNIFREITGLHLVKLLGIVR
jgi:hypothetical protein